MIQLLVVTHQIPLYKSKNVLKCVTQLYSFLIDDLFRFQINFDVLLPVWFDQGHKQSPGLKEAEERSRVIKLLSLNRVKIK